MKKVGNSFKGILGGLLFVVIGIILLWWNEGNNVRNIKTTNEMKDSVIDVESGKVDPANEGKLIATHGKLVNEETLVDEDFGANIVTPKLTRIVEVYQWVEKSEEDSDGNTTYSYSKEWSSTMINSTEFHKSGYDNPANKPYDNRVWYSSNVTLGAFTLNSEQVTLLSTDGVYTDYSEEVLTNTGYTKSGNYITNSNDLEHPEIGDVRIIINYNNSTDVSVLAVQTGSSFTEFVSKVGKTESRIMDGVHSGAEMINQIEKENKMIKWLLRLLGFILIASGIGAVFKPLTTLANFVPILGGLVNTAVGLVGFVAGAAISLVVIAIAWIRFRPLVGIGLLVVVAALVFFLIKKKKSGAQPTTTPVDGTNPMPNQPMNTMAQPMQPQQPIEPQQPVEPVQPMAPQEPMTPQEPQNNDYNNNQQM